MRISDKTRRQQRIDQGRCATCGLTAPVIGLRNCEACRLKLNAQISRWQKGNPVKVQRSRLADYYRAKTKVFDHYGRRCTCCGETEEAFLTVDHINNDGSKERGSLYKRIVARKFPDTYQILCWNCNLAKAQRGLCPHQLTLTVVGLKAK